LTEQDIVQADGTVKGAGKQDQLAGQWAQKMTDSFAELSKEISVFADLQNLMDLSVLATLINEEKLDDAADLDLTVLKGQQGAVQLTSYTIPKVVDPQCSFVRGRTGWTVTASGGVEINAHEVIRNQAANDEIASVRTSSLAANDTDLWWWNHK
jgi:autotransporter adhesin